MASPQPESKILVGSLLVGKYRVTREVGRGGMAAVYEAEHVQLGKRVAVKVLAQELSNSAIVIERFFREARAAASVKSPYIVEVYDSGRLEDGRPFIAMEFLDGESLYDRMARVRIIDPQTTVRILGQCAKGLMKAHAIGIVHRDLKPENIHLCKNEEGGEEIAKILDFGLAKFYAPVKPDEKAARLTREGAVFGTPAYMSPEQVKGQGNVDHRADLWALGCMAFECLTGRPVWNTDQGVAMTFAAIAAAALPIPSRLRPELPPEFDEWFRHALERDPAKRFQTAKELAEALARAFGTPHPSLIAITSSSDLEAQALAATQLVNVQPAISGEVAHVADDTAPQHRQPMSSPSGQGPRSSGTRGSGDGPLSRPRTPGPAGVAPPGFDANGEPRRLELTSIPDDLQPRLPGPSALDLPPTASAPGPLSSKSVRTRIILSSVGVIGAAVVAYLAWAKLLRPQVYTPVVTSSAVPASAASIPEMTVVPSGTGAVSEEPRWSLTMAEAQRLLSVGDTDGALKKLKEAQDQGGGSIAKSLADQVKVGAAVTTGPCKVVGLSHPRTGYGGNIGRPAVATVGHGAVVTWTDDHERTGHDHAYSVLVDPTGHPISPARDLTPEADYVMRPSLLGMGDRSVLLYWDAKGREAGIRVRWIDADGRIGSPSVPVGAARPGSWWPTMDRVPADPQQAQSGTFFVAWQDDRDKEGGDLFLRHLDADLNPVGPEVRATDYAAPQKGGTGGKPTAGANVRLPSVAVGGANLFVAYALDKEKQHTIDRMRIALAAPELGTGLEDKSGPAKKDRELGDVVVVSEDRIGGDFPDMACGRDGCFVVWQNMTAGKESGGASVALIDPAKGIVVWHKRFATLGGRPAIAANDAGDVAAAFYEGQKVRIVSLSRDGVGSGMSFGHAGEGVPRPWIAPGKARGEWYVSWLDYEDRHTEVFASRLACKL